MERRKLFSSPTPIRRKLFSEVTSIGLFVLKIINEEIIKIIIKANGIIIIYFFTLFSEKWVYICGTMFDAATKIGYHILWRDAHGTDLPCLR